VQTHSRLHGDLCSSERNRRGRGIQKSELADRGHGQASILNWMVDIAIEGGAVAELDVVRRAGDEAAAEIHLGIGGEKDACGINEEKIGAAERSARADGRSDGAVDGGGAAGDAGQDVGDVARDIEIRSIARAEIKIREAVEEIIPGRGSALDVIKSRNGRRYRASQAVWRNRRRWSTPRANKPEEACNGQKM